MVRPTTTAALKTVASWPDHLLTLGEWSALPELERGRCRELVDGVLVVAPQPPRHQLAVWRMAAQLEPALPRSVAALARIELVIDDGTPPTVRVPDVLVVGGAAGAAHADRVEPADVLAAVEIISPGSRRTDRIMKMTEYAESGIAEYWLLDIEGTVCLRTHRLRGDRYEPTGEHTGRVTLELEGISIPLDLDALTALRTAP
ncbi:Uma2 family endonuclease [Nocardia sp. NPDC055321]